MTESFEDFVRSRTAALLRLAYLLAGDRQLAEDLVQEVLVKVHRRWSRVRGAGNADAYVRRMLVNEHLSRRRRQSSDELATDEIDTGLIEDSQEAVAARDEMWRLLAALPARQRAVQRRAEGEHRHRFDPPLTTQSEAPLTPRSFPSQMAAHR